MRSIRQLLRQPQKTLPGILLIALASAILCVSVGQYCACQEALRETEAAYITVALTTSRYTEQKITDAFGNVIGISRTSGQPREISQWIEGLPEQYPQVVERICKNGLASAYIPALTPENQTQYDYAPSGTAPSTAAPYTCAVLEITLTDIGEAYPNPYNYPENCEVRGVCADLTGTVLSAVALQEGFDSPVGRTLQATLTVPSQEDLDAMELEVGGTYLIYGSDYTDLDWVMRRNLLGTERMPYEDSLDPDRIVPLTPEENRTLNRDLAPGEPSIVGWYFAADGDGGTSLTQNDLDCMNTVSLQVCDYSAMPQTHTVFEDGGVRREYLTDTRYRSTESGAVQMSVEEYRALYGQPTIARLTGSVEAFLKSEEGASWRQAMEELEINNHGLPVLGVEQLGSLAQFARQEAGLVQGRDFTPAEYKSGAKVCIMAESLAVANGLALGDTITLQYYNCDENIHGQESFATADPTAAFYSRAEGFCGQGEAYTIVGLYRQINQWIGERDGYSFTPNTLFVPQSAVPAAMRFGDSGVFSTLVLKNGSIEELQRIEAEAGYEGLFACYDQGYSEIAGSLDAYGEISKVVLPVGIAAWVGIVLLFLVLFPLRQRGNLARMISLGASFGEARRHLLADSLGVLLPGVLLGTVLGAFAWDRAIEKMMEAASVELTLGRNALVFAGTALLQLAGMLLALLAVSLGLCRDRGLQGRRGKP